MFTLNIVTIEDFVKEVDKLDPKKSSTGVSISLLKENIYICAPKLTEIFISCISKGIFPDELKVADNSSIFKSVDSTAKKNYRTVSILKLVSMLSEKMVQSLLNAFFDEKPSQHLCGFRKGYNTKYALLELR